VIARFGREGVDLALDKREYIFIALALSYLLDGISIADHDFQNILGMNRADAEKLRDALDTAEATARTAGTHWNPAPRE
jgi:hypothetical protein